MPTVLHISCHGVKKKIKRRVGLGTNNEDQLDGHFLLFENNFGDGDLVKA